jgi:hypothetical protein
MVATMRLDELYQELALRRRYQGQMRELYPAFDCGHAGGSLILIFHSE